MTDDILDKIVAVKKEEIEAARRRKTETALRRLAENREPSRPFAAELRQNHGVRTGVVAEIKRASPSRGVIRKPLDAENYARMYEAGGAAAISVLTDRQFFQGSLADLIKARRVVSLPVLRKDFLISTYQIYEAAVAGADAVLLITRLLEQEQLADYLSLCRTLGLDALVEIHDESDLDKATLAGADLIGINNRDLRTFATDTTVSIRLVARFTPQQVPVAASGINTADDIRRAKLAGIHNFLIGESLVRARDTVGFLRQLVNG